MKNQLRIRLSRFGRKNQPVYNIVVAPTRTARDKLPLEVIGTYNPVPTARRLLPDGTVLEPVKNVELDFNRAKYWLSVGALPSDTVSKLLKKAELWV